jgi:Domain of unknown function (DUF4388)
MPISGHLSEFSLPEIFQLLEQGNKTGRLSIQERSATPSYKGKIFRIWFQQGNIVAAADRTDGQGLLSMIQQRGWISGKAAARIAEVCGINQPTGLCLKSQGLLEAEHLKLLFSQQVLQQICKLFELKDGYFQFDPKTVLPSSEMTGLAAPPKEATLAGLRVLRDWAMLQDKLPEPTSGLVSTVSGKPQLRLNQLEWQVWEFARGNTPIQDIAKQLNLPTEKIQQVAFRLMLVDLAEEVPLVSETLTQVPDFEMAMHTTEGSTATAQTSVSQSFLHNLMGFLKGKA